MKKLIILLLLASCAFNVFSYSIVDSLRMELEKAATDSIKIEILLKLADSYYFEDINKTHDFFNKAKILIEKRPFKERNAYYYYVNGFIENNNPTKALECFKKSLQLYTERKDQLGIAKVNLAMGATYASQSKGNMGMQYYLAALKNYQSLNRKEDMGICYSNIGIIYFRQDKFDKALEYSRLALGNFRIETRSYLGENVQIANIYSSMNDQKTALLYYDSLVPVLKSEHHFDLLSNVYNNMGAIYEDAEDFSKAKQYYRLSYDAAIKVMDNYYLISACLRLSNLLVYLNQLDSSITLLEKNRSIISQYKSYKYLSSYYETLSLAYEKKGDLNSAFRHFKLYKSANDSLNDDLAHQRLYELQTSFEVDRKDKEIESLNKENHYKSLQMLKQRIIIVLVLFSTLLFLTAAFVLHTRFRLKHKLARMLEVKNKEIEQQQHEIIAMNGILEKQNEGLLEMDRMKSRFFTNISHEFRTPLSLIIAPLTVMQEKANEQSLKNEFCFMLKHAHNLLSLVNQLLDLSKLQKASLRLQLAYNDINEFLCTLTDTFVGCAMNLSVTITYRPASKPYFVWFDRAKLETIMVNLISNALKHTPKGGFVDISLSGIEVNSDYIEIKVCDSGMGIEEHEIKNIFEPFYQSNATVKHKIEGSGIGLALVKELVELHGGNVSVESEVGNGAQFTIRIAVNKQLLPSAEILSDQGVEPVAFGGYYKPYANDLADEIESKIIKGKTIILVVEDNDDMRRYIAKSLIRDYQIVEAVNGKEGLNKAIEVSPDLIITDVMMPEMNGYEMTRQIKNDQRTSHIPVIILTAKASESSKIDGLEAAADDYLVKPFNMAELLLRIKNAITNRQKLRDKFQKCITVNPSEITATSLDEQFLMKALRIIESHIEESEFSVDDFCIEIGISKTHVYRKLKALTNQSFTEFMRCIRLKRAASLLHMKSGNLTEIAFQTGFTNLSYFSRSFKEQFGVSPSEYAMKPPSFIKE